MSPKRTAAPHGDPTVPEFLGYPAGTHKIWEGHCTVACLTDRLRKPLGCELVCRCAGVGCGGPWPAKHIRTIERGYSRAITFSNWRCTCLRPPQARCWAPEGGSRRGAHQRMSRRRRGSACCRRQYWGGGIGRHESAHPPPTTSHRAGGPLLGLGHLFPALPGTPTPTTHGDMGREGRAAGGWVSHSPSHGRTASVALAS